MLSFKPSFALICVWCVVLVASHPPGEVRMQITVYIVLSLNMCDDGTHAQSESVLERMPPDLSPNIFCCGLFMYNLGVCLNLRYKTVSLNM